MKIDFVIIWVDGNDAEWKKERALYDNNVKADSDNGSIVIVIGTICNIGFEEWKNIVHG